MTFLQPKLWSHQVAQVKAGEGAVEPDLQEALSRRYGAGALIVLPLSSGSFAIFGPDRQLIELSDGAPSAEALRAWSEESQRKVREARESAAKPQGASVKVDRNLGL